MGRMACLAIVLAVLPTAVAFAADEPPGCEQVASIGVATMAGDGTITLRIVSLPPGPIGHTVLVYRPGHERYDAVKLHIGGIAPGQEKPVPPWC